jgi:L-asparaginase/Glu-tRNA(Gln) amidotransferase subunit D
VRSLDGVVATYKDGKIYPVSAHLEKEDATAPLESATPKSIAGNSLFLRVHPGMLYPTPPENTRAVLFEAYHSGTLPTADAAFADFTSMLQAKGIPTFVTGITGEAVYESTTAFEGLGLIPLPRMSPLAAYMKLTLTLAAGLDPKEILSLSLGGDLAPQCFDRKEKQ